MLPVPSSDAGLLDVRSTSFTLLPQKKGSINIDIEIKQVHKDILELGLGALAHANYHASCANEANEKWAELSVLQAAHAAELLVKARIAQEHPLLLFSNFPTVPDNETLSIDKLAKDGKTIEWSDLPKRFKAITGHNFKNSEVFQSFGRLRNSVQHFGIIPNRKETSASLATLQFIYAFIDPFINEHWGMYAIDFNEYLKPYIHLPKTLIEYDIQFLVSSEAAKYSSYWADELESCSDKCRSIMKKRIQDASSNA